MHQTKKAHHRTASERLEPLRKALLLVSLLGVFLASVVVWIILFHCDYAQGGPRDFKIMRMAGIAILHGHKQLIYPSLESLDFSNTLFSGTEFIFLYPPNCAAFATIFCTIPPLVSYIVLQITLVGAIFLSAWLMARSSNKPSYVLPGMLLFVLTFLPAAHSVAIGQLGFLVNFLPLVAGYSAIRAQKLFTAGCIWGLISLKPQLLISITAVLVMILLFCCQNNRDRLLLGGGFLTTLVLNVALILLTFGAVGIPIWIHSMNLWMNSYLYGHIGYSEPYWLIASLPMIIGYTLKTSGNLPFGALIPTTLGSIALVIEILVLYKIARSSSLDFPIKLELFLLLSVVSLPVTSPYLRSYDLPMYIVSAWLCFYGRLASLSQGKLLRTAIIVAWLVINIDMFTVGHSSTIGPVIVCVVAFTFWLCSLVVCLRASSRDTKKEIATAPC